ncbi:rod shape-determining protein RodA [Rhabdothermincola sediminis]|uniref:rod shape-determining protein RodA n=1 Tax=Rhabdothermincola sediminis TaxID=2751370 RepID=UPI001AA078D1|nr:rod shape-determining protein RodA [Rhabdothermincola sediminis]
MDVVLVVSVAALAATGVLMVYSATRGPTDPPDRSFLVRQALFVTIGAAVMVVVTLVDYRRLRDWAWTLYGAMMLGLLGVLSPLGQQSKGAQAWFGFGAFQVQPAEFAKAVLILTLAAVLAMWAGDIDLRRLAVLLGVSGAPMALILLQPDLGTVLVLVSIVLGMLLVAGLRLRYIVALTLVGLIGVVGILNSNVLKQYQKDRLTAFLDPGRDTQGTTYNVTQSQIAVASGGLTGEGLFDGRQTQLQFVPEQQTDFIFTAVGEELGFAGAATVLGLYGVVMWRIWRTAQLSRDLLGTLLCVGVLSMLAFQVFENVGMAMGIMPVTGIPLPLLSYGGSSTLTTFASLGLVLNVHMRRFR